MSSEQKILDAFKKLKEANAAALSRQTGFSTAYVDVLCKSLIKSGELIKAEGKYKLAVKGKESVRAVKQVLKKKKVKKEKGWFPDWLR